MSMASSTLALTPPDELSSLQQLAPGSTVALLTVRDHSDVLVVDRLVGPAAHRLRDLTIDVGYQVSGWVAANWVPMVNADAQLDLDVRAEELRYVLSMPLLSDHRLAGVLTMYCAEPFGDAVLQRVDLIMPQLAAALAYRHDAPTVSVSRDLRLVTRH